MKWSALFPGQGSQFPGMGRFLYEQFPLTRSLFEEADDILKQRLSHLCFEGPEDELKKTENTQPALLLVSVASWMTLNEIRPFDFDSTAGHSVGEFASLVAGKVLSFADAIACVKFRGQAMQKAVPMGEGGMVAVMGLSDEQVQTLCQWVNKESGSDPVEPANFNAPGQVVISGPSSSLDWMRSNFDKDQLFQPSPKKVRLLPLKVSAPFHCQMMKPAEEQMRQRLSDVKFSPAQIPVVQNKVAEAVVDPEEIRENLIQQVSNPVQWVKGIECLLRRGVSHSIELGPGQVLAGLNRKIAGEQLTHFGFNSLEDVKTIENLKFDS